MKFKSKVWRGNIKGAGFVPIPKNYYNIFKIGENLKVEILDKEITANIFYPIVSNYKKYLGFYIPRDVCATGRLFGKMVKVSIKKLNGFHSKLMSDGRLYIPQAIARKYNLKRNDLIVIEGNVNNEDLEKICKVHARERKNRMEYFCIFSIKHGGQEGIFKVKKRLAKGSLPRILKFILADVNYGKINKEKIIAFFTNKRPLILPSKLKIDKNLSYYLGCYFADGTKRGLSWGITASTFEQANFYLGMHKKLILNPDLHCHISITLETPIDKNEIIKLWEDRCKIKVENIRLEMSNSHSKKLNPYGSLIIREYTQSSQIFYRKLLEYVVQKIIRHKSKELALDFVSGVLEGDGSPSTSSRGHIMISTDLRDEKILEKIIEVSGLDFCIQNYQTKCAIRINSLGILKNLDYLRNKIFRFYPKRRKKFIERFSKMGAVRFILGKQDYCSPWVKAWLKEEGILNKKYHLSRKGFKIRNILEDMVKECE